jgi:hypothetical protein
MGVSIQTHNEHHRRGNQYVVHEPTDKPQLLEVTLSFIEVLRRPPTWLKIRVCWAKLA